MPLSDGISYRGTFSRAVAKIAFKIKKDYQSAINELNFVLKAAVISGLEPEFQADKATAAKLLEELKDK
jgi:hypothetical protein